MAARQRRPLVSILTPSLNQAAWLRDNLASVASQTYREVEHIVMDGGSTDDTVAILGDAPSTHVRWRSELDRGQGHALNKAFEDSRGAVIGWVNSDDALCDRRAIEWVVSYLLAHPDVDAVFGAALLVDSNNVARQVLNPPRFSRAALEAVNFIVQPTVFMRRAALEREPFFVREDLRYVIDRDLWFRLAGHARFARIPGILAIDRHQPARKVSEAGYPEEASRFDLEIGIQPSAGKRIRSLSVRARSRLVGLPQMALLPRQVVPAVDLIIPSLPKRLGYQLLLRRAAIHPSAS